MRNAEVPENLREAFRVTMDLIAEHYPDKDWAIAMIGFF